MRELVTTLYAYNTWAMAESFKTLCQLSPEEYAGTTASGHGSIRDSVAHLLAVQWGWFSWFDRSTPMAEAYARVAKVRGEDVDTVENAVARWQEIDRQTRACVDQLDDEQLKAVWSWTLPNGAKGALPLWQMIVHVANHQTHMRAQIAAAVRRAGHTPSNTDFLNFVMSIGRALEPK